MMTTPNNFEDYERIGIELLIKHGMDYQLAEIELQQIMDVERADYFVVRNLMRCNYVDCDEHYFKHVRCKYE